MTKVSTAMASDDFATDAQIAALRAIFIGTIHEFDFVPSEPWWVPCFGQTVNRADYPLLAARKGIVASTFKMPDKRGRVTAGLDNMGGTSANRLTNKAGGVDGDVLGAVGGFETHTLTIAQLASHPHTVTGVTSDNGEHDHDSGIANGTGGSKITGGASNPIGSDTTSIAPDGQHAHTVTGTAEAAGGDEAHNNVQPTIVHCFCMLAY